VRPVEPASAIVRAVIYETSHGHAPA
jgi:hypothetical protein